MSTTFPELPDSPSPGADPRRDGAVELDRRTVFRLLFEDPAVRNYAVAAGAGLAMLVLGLVEQGSDFGGLSIAVVGLSGVLLRWPAAPIFVLLILTYFMWAPLGYPGSGYAFEERIWRQRFQFGDVLLVLAAVVYLISQYRLFGLLSQALPQEEAGRAEKEPLLRRPSTLIRQTELGGMLLLAAILVVIGQLVWLFATGLEIVPEKPIPLKPIDLRYKAEHFVPIGASRALILVGLLFGGTMLARLIFGYWRLRVMGREEARMIILDEGWRETARERVRLEKWRAWGRRRAAARSSVDTKNKGRKR